MCLLLSASGVSKRKRFWLSLATLINLGMAFWSNVKLLDPRDDGK